MMVLCGFSLIGGGILLSTNYSQAEVDGGEVTDPGEGEEEENPGDGEGGDGDLSPDANTEFAWTVKGIYRTSSTSYSTAYSGENDTNNADSKVRFSVYWRDENGNTATLKSAIGYTLNAYPTTGYTVGGGSDSSTKMSDGTSYTFTSGQYYWFEVEPIRWRVSDYGVSSTSYPSGWGTYGTYKTNFTVVSDRILTLGAIETDNVSEGWAFSSSDMYSNISGLNKAASTTNFSAGITNKQAATGYTYYRFGDAGQQDKVVSVSVTEDGVRVASIEEIDEYLTDYSAKASDMVCFLLGCGTDDKVNYWTRNLGTGLGNG